MFSQLIEFVDHYGYVTCEIEVVMTKKYFYYTDVWIVLNTRMVTHAMLLPKWKKHYHSLVNDAVTVVQIKVLTKNQSDESGNALTTLRKGCNNLWSEGRNKNIDLFTTKSCSPSLDGSMRRHHYYYALHVVPRFLSFFALRRFLGERAYHNA